MGRSVCGHRQAACSSALQREVLSAGCCLLLPTSITKQCACYCLLLLPTMTRRVVCLQVGPPAHLCLLKLCNHVSRCLPACCSRGAGPAREKGIQVGHLHSKHATAHKEASAAGHTRKQGHACHKGRGGVCQDAGCAAARRSCDKTSATAGAANAGAANAGAAMPRIGADHAAERRWCTSVFQTHRARRRRGHSWHGHTSGCGSGGSCLCGGKQRGMGVYAWGSMLRWQLQCTCRAAAAAG